MLVIIDADPIVYRAGFAGESVEYHCILEHTDGSIREEIFIRTGEKTANKLLKEWLASNEGWEVISEDRVIIPEELDHVLSTVKAIIQNTLHAVAKHFDIDIFDIQYRVLLSGPGNFRHDIATVLPYKGNRKDTHKPHWYQQIRNYLTTYWGGEVIEGREADDECAIAQYTHDSPSIICTIDKDLDQVPGHHYDYVRKTFYTTSKDEGECLFYKQVLSGDSTDNIPGCYKVGAVRAAKIVDTIYLDYGLDHEKIWEAILATYAASLDKYKLDCPYAEKAKEEGVEAVCIEMARLVKMQEYVGQLWTPEGEPDDLLEDME